MENMVLDAKTKENLRRQLAALEKQMQLDGNDLDYEAHLHLVRGLRQILNQSGE
jgi:hypothetical protein